MLKHDSDQIVGIFLLKINYKKSYGLNLINENEA